MKVENVIRMALYEAGFGQDEGEKLLEEFAKLDQFRERLDYLRQRKLEIDEERNRALMVLEAEIAKVQSECPHPSLALNRFQDGTECTLCCRVW
jgi:hypothetical protein